MRFNNYQKNVLCLENKYMLTLFSGVLVSWGKMFGVLRPLLEKQQEILGLGFVFKQLESTLKDAGMYLQAFHIYQL